MHRLLLAHMDVRAALTQWLALRYCSQRAASALSALLIRKLQFDFWAPVDGEIASNGCYLA